MKHTFKSWLIANMEPIVLAIVVPLVLLLFIITENEFILEYFFVILSLSSAPTNDGSSTGLTWFTIALCLCVGGLYFVGGGLWWIVTSGVLSLIGAIYIASFVSNHTEEVLSRRFFYRNSNVDYLEFKMKYTINRFCASFRCIYVLCVLVWILFNLGYLQQDTTDIFNETLKQI